MLYDTNPFPEADADRHAIWEMLVSRDIEAFVTSDWSLVQDDFAADRFFGVHGHFLSNPDSWRLSFPTLDAYRDEWLRQSKETADIVFAEPLREALFRVTNMRDIDINGDRALVHKKFDGTLERANGETERLNWQTLYFCSLIDERWKITGFVGYIPHPLSKNG
ncbi:hypothetical protein [Pararhizobium mangrovi]|uniref:SnoaL-like domain-containing protein n=1 Tax=Pararhizobium mangrovi TaxID=2590452 RepID=A0A506U8P8_9HYPH|nr:hypothetical protein [Pararhizobium mangrovi]TPW30270.1 hypothetical protein FJU11_05960 [Pararhizobium mangrovi]